MRRYAGYVMIVVLCVNLLLALLTVLIIHVVGLANCIALRHIQVYNDDCRFNFLAELARRYLAHTVAEVNFSGKTIFDDYITIQGLDTFKGKIDLFFDKNKYTAEITVYVNGKEKKVKRIL